MAVFEDKKVLITGGSSGIGLATAQKVIEEGGQVLITVRNSDHLEEARDKLGENAFILKNDASKMRDIKNLENSARQQLGHLDGLFLNAGFGVFSPLGDITEEMYEDNFNTNVKGVLFQAQELCPLLCEGAGVVITSSVVHLKGMEGGAVYSATKGAVRSMVRALASDLALRNIRVNAVTPGPIDTNFFKQAGLSDEQADEVSEEIKNQVPLGRFGKAEEVARSGRLSSLLTGQLCDGCGIYCRWRFKPALILHGRGFKPCADVMRKKGNIIKIMIS
jgi:NAD(P)-dependent dehydrogenase (short-subunit alcohol dehydrogenase family)